MTEFSELHDELRAVAVDLLGKERGSKVGLPLLAQAGWTGLEIAEDLGGAGATFDEVAIVCEEMGRATTASGYLGSTVLSAGLLNRLQPCAARDRLLSGLASGTAAVATAVSAESRDIAAAFTMTGTASAPRVHGRVPFVLDAGAAREVLLPATGTDGVPVVVAVPVDSPGFTVEPQPVLDETRFVATVSADGVPVADDAVLLYSVDVDDAGLNHVRDRALVAVACDSLGLAEAMLGATVDYVRVRQQFNRPIGSFQAVKHACADMQVQVSVARQLVTSASRAVAEGSAEAPRAAAMAKAYAGQAGVEVAGKAMQLHGGIGYTWESGIHAYLKRATLNRALFGSPAAQRRWLATLR